MIYSYNFNSQSAKDLAETLGIKRIKHERSKFKGNPNKTVINWGCSVLPEEVAKCKVINSPESVSKAVNKLSFFKAVDGIARTPEWTTGAAVALQWMQDGYVVLSRTKLTGHSGDGIVINGPANAEVILAPLYVKYIKKKDEYRVHVMRGQVIDVQRKARKEDVPDDKINWLIRNHANGFVFVRGEALGEVPQDVIDQAVLAVNALGLDFGAADVIWNDHRKQAFVLEVNSAPGLTGTTLKKYAENLNELFL